MGNRAGRVAAVVRTRHKTRTGRPLAVVASTVNIVCCLKPPMMHVAWGTQNGRKIGTKRNRNRDVDVVFGCRFAGCGTFRFFFDPKRVLAREG